MYMFVCICVSVHVGQRSYRASSSAVLHLCFLRLGLSLNLEAINLTRLVGQETRRHPPVFTPPSPSSAGVQMLFAVSGFLWC